MKKKTRTLEEKVDLLETQLTEIMVRIYFLRKKIAMHKELREKFNGRL